MNDYNRNCPLEDCPCQQELSPGRLPMFCYHQHTNLIKRVNGRVKLANLYPDLKYICIVFCRGSIVLKVVGL